MQTFPVGSQIIEYHSINSTNTKARELLRKGEIFEGAIVVAYEQYAGKGYAQNLWESSPGKNLTVSFVLQPAFLSPQYQFWLTRVLSLALRDTINFYLNPLPPVTIKWPNDIYVANKKIAGILVENSILGDKFKDSICGIGLNVNQTVFLSDAPNPVSLKQLSGVEYDTKEILSRMAGFITHWYTLLRNEQWSMIEREYLQSLYLLHTEAAFRTGDKLFKGSIQGTDQYGRLQIRTAGSLKLFDFKEISFVP